MKFLKHIRSKSRLQRETPSESSYPPPTVYAGADNFARVPEKVLRGIFTFVCPHTQDETYLACESSGTEDRCMLCDVRDLAQCALVCRRWHRPAQELLYSHVRIDAVHYCEREIELSAKRKRKSFMNRNADPIDAPAETLKLFTRTMWDRPNLAVTVHSLKIAYMTRESRKSELARCVSVLPNLRYVDLPEGVFSDDPSCNMLKQEIQAQCPDIRKMKYVSGSEQSFATVLHSRQWPSLEILELSHLNVEPSMLLHVLRSFQVLRELKMVGLRLIDDTIFEPTSSLPAFPPIQALILESMPKVTAVGVATYLSQPQNEVLSSLSLAATGVLPQTLHDILSRAPHLESLSIIEEVARSFPVEPVPNLVSRSLRTLNYEITSNSTPYGAQSPASSYYSYLVNSLHANTLPSLTDLYVRDSDFPESLLLVPPKAAFSEQAGSSGLVQPLSVYSKGLDELEWNFTSVKPSTAPGRRGSSSTTRPISSYNAHLTPAWGGNARKSMMVGNGFGGFLAVPTDDESWNQGRGGSPKSSPKIKVDKRDLWR